MGNVVENKKLNRLNVPTGWRIQTGLNPEFVVSVKQWAKDCGRRVAEAKKVGNVDGAIKSLIEGQKCKKALKIALAEDRPYFVYSPDGKCRYILEYEVIKKCQIYNAEE